MQAWLTHGREAAVDFVTQEGLLMAPAYAVSDLLDDADLELPDFSVAAHDQMGAQLVTYFMDRWERDEALVVLLR